ncbi:MAG: phosphohistidine phosphatase SixA [Phycisphaerales bacterium]|nr:phosphohistidine phosphatase SixA [Phycisphaerales bacterium]
MLVYILRHAKAERESPTGKDEDRPLAPTGIAQARFLGAALADAEPRPDRILTSPAERAARTADIVAAALDLQPREEPRLSPDASFNQVAAIVRGLADEASPSMIVGHNPVLEELVLGLTAGQPEAPGSLRTGELVLVDLTHAGRALQARFIRRLRLGEADG